MVDKRTILLGGIFVGYLYWASRADESSQPRRATHPADDPHVPRRY